jgi:hypothetical protein
MKKSDFKKLIKPLVHECIKESLMEDGMISGIIAEVVRGMAIAQPIVEQRVEASDPELERLKKSAFSEQQVSQLQEHRAKLMSAIGGEAFNGVNLFEGTTPTPAQSTPAQQANPMSGQSPTDAGVDIGNLFGSVGSSWGAHMNNVKKESR